MGGLVNPSISFSAIKSRDGRLTAFEPPVCVRAYKGCMCIIKVNEDWMGVGGGYVRAAPSWVCFGSPKYQLEMETSPFMLIPAL